MSILSAVTIHLSFSSEKVVQSCSVKQVFLKISQIFQESNCSRDFFLIKRLLKTFIKNDTLAKVFSCEFCELRTPFFVKHLWCLLLSFHYLEYYRKKGFNTLSVFIENTEVYSKPFQTSRMELSATTFNSFQPLTIFLKCSILNVWQSSEQPLYGKDYYLRWNHRNESHNFSKNFKQKKSFSQTCIMIHLHYPKFIGESKYRIHFDQKLTQHLLC